MLTPPNLMRLTDYQRSPAFVPTGQAHFVRTGSEFVCFVVSSHPRLRRLIMEETIISFLRVLGAVPFLLPVFPVFLYSVVCDFWPGRVQGSRFNGSTVQAFKGPPSSLFKGCDGMPLFCSVVSVVSCYLRFLLFNPKRLSPLVISVQGCRRGGAACARRAIRCGCPGKPAARSTFGGCL